MPERHPLSRERVVEQAATLIDAEGVDALTLTRLAEDLGVQQPTLYKHVQGFDDLLRALALRARSELTATLADAAIGVSGDAAVRAVADAWRGFVQAHRGLYAVTDRIAVAGDAELEEAVEGVVEVLRRTLGGYDMDEHTQMLAARSLRSAVHGFVHLEAGEGHPQPVDLDVSFEALVTLLCQGLRRLARGEGPTGDG